MINGPIIFCRYSCWPDPVGNVGVSALGLTANVSNAIAILAFRIIQMLDKQIGARISASLIIWHLYYDWTIEDGVIPRITKGRPETLTTLNLQSCNRSVWIEFNKLAQRDV